MMKRKGKMMKGEIEVLKDEELLRLDVVVLNHFPNLTRSHIKTLIDDGKILVNSKKVKAGEKVKAGQVVAYDFDEVKPLCV